MEIFIIIIFIRIWVINYSKDQIIMLRGVLDEVYNILSELWGYEGVSILLPITHGRLAYGHPYPSPCLFILNISRVDGIWVTYSAVASGSIENFPYLIVLLPFPYSWNLSTLFCEYSWCLYFRGFTLCGGCIRIYYQLQVH